MHSGFSQWLHDIDIANVVGFGYRPLSNTFTRR
jgi:hypothetical protein